MAAVWTRYREQADLKGDGTVGPADFNSDGTVGPADLSILLSTWTGDDLLSIPTPSCESESESLVTGMTLEQALVAVGFYNVEAFRDWVLANDSEQVNVTCQIINYLMNN